MGRRLTGSQRVLICKVPSLRLKDRRNVNGRNFISPVKNQDIPQYCDASWAFSVTSALTDRMRYMRGASYPFQELSVQALINCADSFSGCFGGDVFSAYKYIKSVGLPGESCLPYLGVEDRCTSQNICRVCMDTDVCYPISSYHKYYISSFDAVDGISAMMDQIYYNGPITCKISVTNDLQNYRNGIFSRNTSSSLYDHYVNIIGWGSENETPYWIVRNSWGSSWGEDGYFRILRGVNLLGIESSCSYAVPSVTPISRNETNSLNQTNSSNSLNQINSLNPSTSPNPLNSLNPLNSSISFLARGFATNWTANPPVIHSPLPWTYVNLSSLPTQYDIRSLDGVDYSTPIRTQRAPQFCNACWAQAAVSALSDRLQLQSRGAWPMVVLSTQMVVNCATGSCDGGDPGEVYRFAYMSSISDESCQVYEGKKNTCNGKGRCMDCRRFGECMEVTAYRKVSVSEYGEVLGIDQMKAEIYERGPITCFMVVTEQFQRYTGGVFVEEDHHYLGGHIVEVVGWGRTEEGVEYWIGRNNWGENWGEKGWFRIMMGENNLLIESSCSWGVPFVH